MSTVDEGQSKKERSWVYITACLLLGALAVAGVIAFSSAVESRQAEEKADELIAALEEVGARAPDQDVVVHVLGEDGGATCADPNAALSRGVLLSQLVNGATGPGQRPVIADSRIFQGQLLILEVYCPDELEEFKSYVEDLETDDVAG